MSLLQPNLIKSITRTNTLLARHNTRNFFSKFSPRSTDVGSGKTSGSPQEGLVFIDSIFAIRLARWDIRHLFGPVRQDNLAWRIRSILSSVNLPDFELLSVDPHIKDGGVFVRFRYLNLDGSTAALEVVEEQLREHVEKEGGLPSWTGSERSHIWVVKGRPWLEDMKRFPSPILKVTFDGPDVPEESLYKLLRPYGRIADISPPMPGLAGNLRYSTISFTTIRSATIAKNVIHGFQFSSDKGQTRLGAGYERPLQVHAIRDWSAKHPRIILPIVFFLLGTVTYTVFDPIRTLMVQGKIMNWFDYRESQLYQWVRKNTFDRISQGQPESFGAWKERSEAVDAVKTYLSDPPTTIAFVHGPQGSEKFPIVSRAVKSMERKMVTIDCAEIYKYQDSEPRMVAALAQQTGYWPTFAFLDSVNKMIDLVSVGITGQNPGLSSSLTEQLKQILEVVGTSLGRASASHQDRVRHAAKVQVEQMQTEKKMKKVQKGVWHDGRLDCVSGNGLMSELGIGDEPFGDNDSDIGTPEVEYENGLEDKSKKKSRNDQEAEAVNSLPVVIIRNYDEKSGKKGEVFDVLTQWAVAVVQNKIAHVIVISDNRENSKRLAKSLTSKPLNIITLSDADSQTALSFVQQKLRDTDVEISFSPQTKAYIERLGGRASDLETLISKVRSGSSVEDAVEDIITRGVAELRKNAFGDDVEDANTLPWTREEVWGLMKQFATRSEVPYHDVLLNFPFNGDEMALRNMERAELISISTQNGRPATIRPGKPVYKYVFERVIEDTTFAATQDISFNSKMVSGCETTIRSCEEELSKLTDIGERTKSPIWGEDRAIRSRIKYLLKKMGDAESKIEVLERANARLKKIIAQR